MFGIEMVEKIVGAGSEKTVDIANEVVAVETEDHVEVALEKRWKVMMQEKEFRDKGNCELKFESECER